MKRIHPSARYAAHLAALAVSFAVVGCRNQSGGNFNPFLAPDRVPPPATRALAPGQAQPYYPGDPLPVMQSNAAPQVDASGLAWTGPNNSQPAPADFTASSTRSTASTVAIPQDNDALRFALPEASEPAPFVPAATAAPMQLAVEPTNQAAAPASYSEPAFESFAPAAVSPWRSPEIAQSALPPPPTGQPMIAQGGSPAPPVAIPPSMDVRLRAVASPPPAPGEPTSPRIRLPGQAVPESASYDGFRPRSSMR